MCTIIGVSCLLSVASSVCVRAYDNSIKFSKTNIKTWNQGSNGFAENDSQMLCRLSSSDTIHKGGCGHFAITSILVKCGYLNPKTESPIDVVKFAYENDLYDAGWGHFNPNNIGKLNSDLECVSAYFDLSSYSLKDALAFLKKKYYEGYFLQVCVRASGVTNGHYIFIDGYDNNGDIIITDSGFYGTKWSDLYGKSDTHIKYVNIYKSKSGKNCNELKSVYEIDGGSKKLFATGTSIDTTGSGSTSSDGRSQSPEQFLEILQKYSDNVKKYKNEGIYTVYSNNGVHNVYSVAVAKAKEGVTAEVKGEKKTNVHRMKVNCALMVTWALNEIGILEDGQAMWGTKNKTVHYTKGAKENIEKYCDVTYFDSSTGYPTASELVSSGKLQPGDIVTWASYGHTNVYAGDNEWYDTGRGGPCTPTYLYTDIRSSDMLNGLSCIFYSFGPCKSISMGSTTVSAIIRLKTIEGLSEDEMNRYEKLVSEWELDGMPEQFNIADAQISITFTSVLSTDEEKMLEEIKSGIEDSKLNILETARVVIAFVGLLLMIYGILFFTAYLFDLSNNFIDIRLLSVISLGRYAASSEKDYGSSENSNVTYMTTRMVIKRVIVLEAVGLLLVSGNVYRLLRFLLSYVKR